MAKVFRCRDIGMACNFVACAETEEDILKRATEHAQAAHKKEITEEFIKKVRAAVREQDQETKRAHWLLVLLGGGLVLSVIIYLVLHWAFPPGELLPETKARDEALAAIVQATEILTDTVMAVEPSTAVDRIRTVITNTVTSTVGARLTVTETAALSRALAEEAQKVLTKLAIEGEKAHVNALIPGLKSALDKIPWVDASGVISPTMAHIKDEIEDKEEHNRGTLRLLFARLDEEVKRGGDRYFWSTGFGRWVEFTFWSLFGTLAYLLATIHKYYPEDSPERRFRDFTPWYFTTIFRGPLVALLILFFITVVKVEVSGIGITLGEARIELLIFLAAVLGFYSQVAKEQLDIFVKMVFPKAWEEAQKLPPKMAIEPSSLTLELEGKQQFTVVPAQDVIWSYEPEVGTLTVGGLYTAPTGEDKAGQKVTIKATSATDPTKFATATIVLIKKKLVVKPDKAEVKFETTQSFSVEPKVEVKWTIEPADLGAIDVNGKYTAPHKGKPEGAQPGKQVTVKATRTDDPTSFATAKVTLIE